MREKVGCVREGRTVGIAGVLVLSLLYLLLLHGAVVFRLAALVGAKGCESHVVVQVCTEVFVCARPSCV